LTSALIGYTGFVGGNLSRQHAFDCLYNSKNIEEIAGREFDLVVCAGAPAEKWKANQDPTADWQSIERLAKALTKAQVEKLILISTVDVYGNPQSVNEDDEPQNDSAYGAHRLRLEQILSERFSSLIVRLPGLFGTGLKKNAIYDLLHNIRVERIDSRGVYQFYGLDTLWRDIRIAQEAGLSLVNFATEPVAIHEVAQVAFGKDFHNEVLPSPPRYDMWTRHARLYNGGDKYLQTKTEVLNAIRAFIVREQQQGKKCA